MKTAEREHLTTASDALHQFAQLRKGTGAAVPEAIRQAHAAVRAALSSADTRSSNDAAESQ